MPLPHPSSPIRSSPTLCWSVAASPSTLGIALHDAGYAAAGLDFKYVALGSTTLAPVITALRALNVRGLSVSIPHKQSIIAYLDEVTPAVQSIGACNTVVNHHGYLIGHNTDWTGAQLALDEQGLGHPATALIIGSGGVARALAYALKVRGTAVSVAARNYAAAQLVVAELELSQAVPLNQQQTVSAELLLNATPDASPTSPLRLAAHPHARALLDVVIQPRTTPLIASAQQLGLNTVAGWRMLLHQGCAQFELYTETPPPFTAMEAALHAALPPH